LKLLILIILFFTKLSIAQSDSGFIKGFDVSFIPQIENLGGKYYLNYVLTDPLEIFKLNDINYIRLRLWHSPADGYCGLGSTLDMASRIKEKGLKFLLNFHYSDTWADPGSQDKPAAWDTLSFDVLVDSIYSYTFDVLHAFDAINALPDMVQIGNEIIGGMLWNDGRINGSYNTPEQWEKFTTLLKSAIQGARDAVPDTTIPLMIHIDRGGDNSASRWFFDHLNSAGVQFDVIGQSFYPWWHGTLTQLENNINDLAVRYNKDIYVVETAYPWTLAWFDTVNNIVGSSDQLHTGYPATVEGQSAFLADMIEIIKNAPNNRGKGLFYWEPAYISVDSLGSSWENLTLFDFQGNVLNSIEVFRDTTIDTSAAINVTFNLNTAAHFDTLSPEAFVQLRGEVVNGSEKFISGEEITWDMNSKIILENLNGDYWQKTIRVLPGTEINYKYWTGHNRDNPTFLGLGWEGPILSYDSAGSYRKFIAGVNDTILPVEYYNPSGVTEVQFWQPFEHKEDSIAVRFKVNMAGTASSGRFDPEINGPVGVRGDPINTINILSWDQTKIILSRDSLSLNNGSFWSGTAYYPLSTAGIVQYYRFYIVNDTGNGLESNIPDRTFTLPFKDTTIYWVYFDNQGIITNIQNRIPEFDDFMLYQNYPNPFNPSTKINFELKHRTRINLAVFNYLGEKVATLANKEEGAGKYFFEWNGNDSRGNNVSSGIYFIRIAAGTKMKSIKALLLK
jgi:arabinogalactan endo-1,4-beta-galactosidase